MTWTVEYEDGFGVLRFGDPSVSVPFVGAWPEGWLVTVSGRRIEQRGFDGGYYFHYPRATSFLPADEWRVREHPDELHFIHVDLIMSSVERRDCYVLHFHDGKVEEVR